MITQVPEQVFAVGLVGKAAALVATVSQYCAAPETWLQPKVGVVDTPDCPLGGFDRVGAESVAVEFTVKYNTEDVTLEPAALDADTPQ